MRIEELDVLIQGAINTRRPFVCYTKPQNEEVVGVFQKDSKIYLTTNFSESGFVFAPFDETQNKSFYIPENVSEKKIFHLSIDVKSHETNRHSDAFESKEIHEGLVNATVDKIKSSLLDKVVISRKEQVNTPKSPVILFTDLLEMYPNAFVYLWYHPETGLWLGATPERLVHVKEEKFKVMALASTQEFQGTLDVEWGDKEKEEHQIVVDYIEDNLKAFNCKTSETYTVKAGNLLHLRADISGDLNSKINLGQLISKIHPTPATCGMPKDVAKDFILKNEGYDREYYTGFLGEISQGLSDLYVNLRCMKYQEDGLVSIFVGGGITKDSIPEKEWQETCIKSQVMKKVL